MLTNNGIVSYLLRFSKLSIKPKAQFAHVCKKRFHSYQRRHNLKRKLLFSSYRFEINYIQIGNNFSVKSSPSNSKRTSHNFPSENVNKKIIKDEESEDTNEKKGKIEVEHENEESSKQNNVEVDSRNKATNFYSNEEHFHALFPPSFPEPKSSHNEGNHDKKLKGRNILQLLKEVLIKYKETWTEKEEEKEAQENMKEKFESAMKTRNKIVAKSRRNLQKNVNFLREKTRESFSQLQKDTGVYNAEDAKAYMKEMMTVAIDCVSEFMKGYRSGRDNEMERVLNEKIDEDKTKDGDQPKKPRRKIRTRDLTFI